ncbi:hypothetical protein MGYG_02341 [Nannizzia gypsea CBS 118893]|uniref:Uncharacterized protein n=1 Tax=Arthroderma gypseum (strain ATCC MYA-4604 / CBS 118893) TaxID=535722 RepID=E4UR53_ARTGP|nr:hypothetical protein MGYG_02341 [Nannizzia gypsea CBS 118893]EFQ99328.1 hypothetical protein MGYG_02341 [Nannizzia gypsea CBS 118893]
MFFYAFHSNNVTPSRFIKLETVKGLPVDSQFLLYQYALKHERLDIAKEFSLNQQPRPEYVEDICELFEKFAINTCLDELPEQELIQYFEWFSSNGYNLVVKHYRQLEVTSSTRVIDSCIKILDKFPKCLGVDALSSINRRMFWCQSMATLALLDIAYMTENHISKDLYFTSARMHLQRCQSYVTTHHQETAPEEWSKFSEVVRSLIALYFDSAIRSNQGIEESICAILGICDPNSDPQVLCILADRIISSGLTTPAVYRAFQRATALKLTSGGLCEVLHHFRWLRCLYRFGLKCEENCAKSIVGESHKLVDIATNLRHELSLEMTRELCWEMQWLPIAVYNQSLVFYKDMKNSMSQEWFNEAINLIQEVELKGWDTDSLFRRMSEAYGALTWKTDDPL